MNTRSETPPTASNHARGRLWDLPVVGLLAAASVGLSTVAVLGPAWAARLAVLIAIGLALLAGISAWARHRRLLQLRDAEAGERLLEASRRHGAQISAERTQNGKVISMLRRQLSEQYESHTMLYAKVEAARSEVSVYKTQVQSINDSIDSLRATLIAGELKWVPRAADSAELYTMPRRTRTRDRHLAAASAEQPAVAGYLTSVTG